jgi:transcriptional antiterminator
VQPGVSTAQEVLGQLGQELCLPIPEAEAACLAAKLLGAQVDRRLSAVAGGEPDQVDVTALVEQLMEDAGHLLDPRLAHDQQLAHELTAHLEPFLQRLQLGVGVHNPLLEDVKATYPHVFRVASWLSELLAQQTGRRVPEEEIGYIAMYLGAALERLRPAPRRRVLIVCPLGVATSHMLAARLQAEFPQLDLVQVSSVRDLLAQPLTPADVIISTVRSIPVQTHLPIIRVHPLLPPDDVARIRELLAGDR